MPELPEVETMVRGIRESVEGNVLTDFARCPCLCKPVSLDPGIEVICQAALGQKVHHVWRRAKRVVLELADGAAFVIEPRMTGLMLVSDPPDVGHLRFEWRFREEKKVRSLWFWDRRGLGTVRFLAPNELEQVLGEGNLGVDALEISVTQLFEKLRQTSRQIKVALLDQKLVAGIGNLYASEILHLAKIHPEQVAFSLSKRQVQRIQECTGEILNEAIQYEGSTLGDGTYRNALNKDGSYQNKHKVYAKAQSRCSTCQKEDVVRIVQAQRATFFCPRCQKLK